MLGTQDEPATQHVAFRCDHGPRRRQGDARAAAGPLPIPDNHYDDLRARLDLDPGLLAELRELHVLFDRDAHGGTFLHCYAPAVGRMFFEVVERGGGYDGYGAADASVAWPRSDRRRPAAPPRLT